MQTKNDVLATAEKLPLLKNTDGHSYLFCSVPKLKDAYVPEVHASVTYFSAILFGNERFYKASWTISNPFAQSDRDMVSDWNKIATLTPLGDVDAGYELSLEEADLISLSLFMVAYLDYRLQSESTI